MIAVSTIKDKITGKQMVNRWSYVTKEYTELHPEIPGERMYFCEKDVPTSFWKDYAIHYVDSHQICVLYPDKVDISPFVVD